jgi:crotonobetainyl-CoA:carnitine CoA-transferase CaiB-like acyl-CoA transferase
MTEEFEVPALDEYTINVRVQGYNGLSMNVKVPAKDPDEAFDLACSKEFRYQDEDLYVLMALTDDENWSALCTYQTLKEAMEHVVTLTSGVWLLVQKDSDDEGASTIIRTSDDEDLLAN